MRYLKLYEDHRPKLTLKDCIRGKYIINADGTIDVEGDVELSCRNLTKIPFKFGKVSGYFDCCYNSLTSLEGCPVYVGGFFTCACNSLINLVGGPIEVNKSYNCKKNKLTSLEGIAAEIGGNLFCFENQLTDLDISSIIGGDIICDNNQIDPNNYNFYGDIKGKIFFEQ